MSMLIDQLEQDEAAIDFERSLWNADGSVRAVLTGHTKPVNQVAWSPDGKQLVSVSDDKTVRLWQIR